MPTLNQEQISALIQFIEQAEDPGVITNVIVAAVLYWLYDKANDLPNKTDKDPITGALTYSQFPPIVLRSMDSELDGVSSIPGLSDGDLCYNETLKKIVKKVQSGLSLTDEVVGDPMPGIIYCNAYTGNLYRWLGSSWSQVGGKNGADAQTIANVNKIQAKFDALIDVLAGYALTEPKTANMKVGKLDWNSSGGGEQGGDEPTTSYSVEQNLTDLDSDYSSESIQSGGKLTIHLSVKSGLTPASNLYVIDDDGVEVIMGEENITASAYDPATGTIEIDEVTGDVEITASAITYVSNGLVLMFDGKNQGSVQGQWENLANAQYPLVLTGYGYTKNTDHIAFAGGSSDDSQAMAMGEVADFGFSQQFENSTAEAVYSQDTNPGSSTAIFVTGRHRGTLIGITSLNGTPCLYSATVEENSSSTVQTTECGLLTGDNAYSANQKVSVSHYGAEYALNGNVLTKGSSPKTLLIGDSGSTYNMDGKCAVCGFISRINAYTFPFDGNLYCIRLYSRALSQAEVAQNFKVDKKRFNIN